MTETTADEATPTHRRTWSRLSGTSRLFGLAPLGALAVFMLFAVRADLGWSNAFRALLAIGLTQTFPGGIAWRLVRGGRPASLLEDVVAGTAVGAVTGLAFQAAAGTLRLPHLAWAPLVLAIAALLDRRLRARAFQAPSRSFSPTWNLAVSATTLPLLIEVQRFYRDVPLAWGSGFRVVPTDVYFHLALTSQVAHRSPFDVPFVLGEPLSYHWFSHAWVAQIATAGSVPLDGVLFRVGPPLLALAVTFAVAIAAVRISGHDWAGPVAALVAVASTDINLFGGLLPFTRGKLLTSGALSLGFASWLLVVLVTLLTLRWREETQRGDWLVVLLLAIGIAGGKGSALPLALAGTAAAFGIGLLRRTTVRRTVGVDLMILAMVFVGTYLTIFGGEARTAFAPEEALGEAGISAFLLQPAPDPSLPLILFGAALVVLSVTARGAGMAVSAFTEQRHDPAWQLLVFGSLAGALAVVLLSVGGKSQYYFLRNAIPLMAVGTAVGIAEPLKDLTTTARARLLLLGLAAGVVLVILFEGILPSIDRPRPALTVAMMTRLGLLVVVLMVAAVLVRFIVESRSQWRDATAVVALGLIVYSVVPALWNQFTSPLPPSPQPVAATDRYAFSADQMEAAGWLRDHAGVDDVVMTNRHCASPTWVNCDSRRFPITAFTERQALLEGWAYTRSWAKGGGGDYYARFWDPPLQDLNDGFIENPDARQAEALYDLGVRWIFIDKTEEWSSDLDEFAAPVYETEWALVFELHPQ